MKNLCYETDTVGIRDWINVYKVVLLNLKKLLNSYFRLKEYWAYAIK